MHFWNSKFKKTDKNPCKNRAKTEQKPDKNRCENLAKTQTEKEEIL